MSNESFSKMNERILVVAAHADDEALGCGGTIARFSGKGHEVHVVFLTDGETSRGEQANIGNRDIAANRAAKILGTQPPVLLKLPDNRLDSIPLLEVVQTLEPEITHIDPHVIYTHHGNDLNIDHRIAHQATLTACRPQPGYNVSAIYGFEILSSTEWASPETAPSFRPTRFVNITEHLERKLEALKCYEKEMRPPPHARSFEAVEALARLRGCSVGLEAAEAFSVIREIVK